MAAQVDSLPVASVDDGCLTTATSWSTMRLHSSSHTGGEPRYTVLPSSVRLHEWLNVHKTHTLISHPYSPCSGSESSTHCVVSNVGGIDVL